MTGGQIPAVTFDLIVSRAQGSFSWMLATSLPSRSFRTKVSRTRSLASDLANAIALVILDPGIIADQRELLLHLGAAAARSIVAVSRSPIVVPSWLSYAAPAPPVRRDIARNG